MRIATGPAPRRTDGALPLVNVVFLLLIFVVLAGRLAFPGELAVDLPRVEAPLALASGGRTLVLTPDRLAPDDPSIEDFAARLVRSAPAGRPVEVTLFAARSADAGAVLGVARRLSRAGVARVELATVPAGTAGR